MRDASYTGISLKLIFQIWPFKEHNGWIIVPQTFYEELSAKERTEYISALQISFEKLTALLW